MEESYSSLSPALSEKAHLGKWYVKYFYTSSGSNNSPAITTR